MRQHEVQGSSRLVTRLYFCFIFFICLDFRSETTVGGFVQQVFAGVALMFALGVFVAGLGRRTFTRYALVSLGFLIYATLVAVVGKVPPGNFIRVVFPFILLPVAVVVTSTALACGVTVETIMSIFVTGSIISMFWRFGYAIFVVGLASESIRYQILSPAEPFLLAWVFAYLATGRKLSVVWVSGLVAALIPVILSVTRSYLLTLSSVPFGGLLIYIYLITKGLVSTKSLGKMLLIGVASLIVGVLAIFLAVSVRHDLFQVWTERLFYQKTAGGQDITYLTRLAEASGIWAAVSDSVRHFVFGLGMGAIYFWDRAYIELLGGAAAMDYFDDGVWQSGHSQWTYLLFSTGALGVLWFGSLLWMLTRRSFSVLRMATRFRAGDGIFIGAFGLLTIIALISQSFTSSPMAERMTGAFLGLVGAILFAGRKAPMPPPPRRFRNGPAVVTQAAAGDSAAP